MKNASVWGEGYGFCQGCRAGAAGAREPILPGAGAVGAFCSEIGTVKNGGSGAGAGAVSNLYGSASLVYTPCAFLSCHPQTPVMFV